MPMKITGLSTAFCVAAFALASCSPDLQQTNQALSQDASAPILIVRQPPYTFSMYPQYKTETESILKLDIRDNKNRFVETASVGADLKAKDGHQAVVRFVENSQLEKYIATVSLKHHEDYTIKTRITLPDLPQTSLSPTFSFHCCDPVPEITDLDKPTTGTARGDQSK